MLFINAQRFHVAQITQFIKINIIGIFLFIRLRTLHENGIIGRLQRKYFQSISKEESQFIEIEISHLYVLLVILGIGVAASFCVMVIERYML